jgi:DNA-binding response OmpR family regulator
MSSGNLILIVDDDKNICELIRIYLEKEGFAVVVENDGLKGLEKFKSIQPVLVILDVMLPGIDGLQICKEIRKSSNVPIIMLTAKGEIFDKVLGLELGADDYVVKPFDAKELIARVKAVMRRFSTKEDDLLEIIYQDLIVNKCDYTVNFKGERLDFPPKELELLYFIATNPNKVFTREQLLEQIWGYEFYGDTRTVDVHIKRIREKIDNIEEINKPWQIKTVWGVGYKFEVK